MSNISTKIGQTLQTELHNLNKQRIEDQAKQAAQTILNQNQEMTSHSDYFSLLVDTISSRTVLRKKSQAEKALKKGQKELAEEIEPAYFNIKGNSKLSFATIARNLQRLKSGEEFLAYLRHAATIICKDFWNTNILKIYKPAVKELEANHINPNMSGEISILKEKLPAKSKEQSEVHFLKGRFMENGSPIGEEDILSEILVTPNRMVRNIYSKLQDGCSCVIKFFDNNHAAMTLYDETNKPKAAMSIAGKRFKFTNFSKPPIKTKPKTQTAQDPTQQYSPSRKARKQMKKNRALSPNIPKD